MVGAMVVIIASMQKGQEVLLKGFKIQSSVAWYSRTAVLLFSIHLKKACMNDDARTLHTCVRASDHQNPMALWASCKCPLMSTHETSLPQHSMDNKFGFILYFLLRR